MHVELWICCFLTLHFQVEHRKGQRDHTALGRRTCRKSIKWMWWQCTVVLYNLNLAPTQCRNHYLGLQNWMPWNSIVLWRPSCKTTLGRFDCESCLCIRVFVITERRKNGLRKQVYGCINLMHLQNSVDVWKSKRHGKEFLKLGMIPFFTHESQAAANSITALDLFLRPNQCGHEWFKCNGETCRLAKQEDSNIHFSGLTVNIIGDAFTCLLNMSLLLGYIPSDHDLMGAELSTDLHDIISDLFQSHTASKLGFFHRGSLRIRPWLQWCPPQLILNFWFAKPFSNFKLLCLKVTCDLHGLLLCLAKRLAFFLETCSSLKAKQL